MKKYLWLKIVISIIIMLTAVTATFLFLVPRREIYNYLYEQQRMEQRTQISAFEAELNYDEMIQQVMGNREITGLSTYDSDERLNAILTSLHWIYQCSKWVCGLGVLLSVAGLIILRNQKWYDVLRLGGILTISVGILVGLLHVLIRPLRLFVLESRYETILGKEPVMLGLMPRGWGLYTFVAGVGGILLIGIALLVLHFISRRSYKPHKF